MSQIRIDLNPDLKRLQDDGYELEIKEGHAFVHSIPYLNSQKQLKFGSLITVLDLNGDKTIRPQNHTIHFTGDEFPCNKDGSLIAGIANENTRSEIINVIFKNFTFSNIPPVRYYDDYYHKFTQYIRIISAPATATYKDVTPRTFKVIEADDESVFHYIDTNSSKASISTITNKLMYHKIGIIGVGGTGAYVLDFVAKTPVSEIHIFDGDTFYQNNAFRAPGAPSKDKLNEKVKKTDYFYSIYRNMHKFIIPYSEYIDPDNIARLSTLDFVFICVDKGSIKKVIIEYLIEKQIPFIDVGIGIHAVDGSLLGSLRVTTCTPDKNAHYLNRIQLSDDAINEYSQNIQIAELNALNATLAVIKWKKLIGFYHDSMKEHNTVFNVETGVVTSADKEI